MPFRLRSESFREYDSFISEAGGLNPIPADVSSAMEEAEARKEEIREKMRTGQAPIH